MSDNVILTEVRDRVATLTLNRPDKLNALSADLIAQSIAKLTEWGRDADIGAIVVTGAGRAFCAGGDVSAMSRSDISGGSRSDISGGSRSDISGGSRSDISGGSREGAETLTLEQRVDRLREAQDLSWLLYNLPKVTIAQVNGAAVGAGLGIALACDLRIAASTAKFGTAYAKVGFGGDFGTTWLLAQYAGAPKAKELFFLGENIDAAEAQRIGIANRVVEPEALAATVAEIASRIAHGPLTSYRYMKANVNLAASTDFRTLLDREAETHLRCGMTDDHREGVRAFLEKRAANFSGR